MVRLTQLMEDLIIERLNAKYAAMSDEEFFSNNELLMENVADKIKEVLLEREEPTA
jgi:hypothetical protein